ncbi:hypothetical protein JW859_04470 [bacterium]|nr:hypothetical protein [bacterium]
MQRLLLHAIKAVALLLLFGCGSHDDEYLSQGYTHKPRTGPASVSGTFTMTVPVVKIASAPLETPAGVSYCPWECPGRLGAFPLDSEWPDGVVNLDAGGFTTADAQTGIYAVDYSFAGIPLDTYELRLSGIQAGDWTDYTYYTLLSGETFTLTAADQTKTGLDWSLDCAQSAEPGSISGAIPLSGNPPFADTAELSLVCADQLTQELGGTSASGAAGLSEFTWSIPAAAAQNGRLFYEITNLPFGDYASNDLISLDTPVSVESETGASLLNADRPAVQGDYYLQPYATAPDAGAINEGPFRYGTIRVGLIINNLAAWDRPLALIAERTAGHETKYHRAIAFVYPGYYGSAAGHNSRLQYLRYLEVGSYDIKLVRLGMTNADEPEVLVELAAPVELLEPAPIAHELVNGYWYEYPVPELDLELEVTLPDSD